jgi:hypothetical protein
MFNVPCTPLTGKIPQKNRYTNVPTTWQFRAPPTKVITLVTLQACMNIKPLIMLASSNKLYENILHISANQLAYFLLP